MKVHDIMSAPPQTCRVTSDLATASRRMKQTATGMLVVFDGHGHIAGVVTDDRAVRLPGVSPADAAP